MSISPRPNRTISSCLTSTIQNPRRRLNALLPISIRFLQCKTGKVFLSISIPRRAIRIHDCCCGRRDHHGGQLRSGLECGIERYFTAFDRGCDETVVAFEGEIDRGGGVEDTVDACLLARALVETGESTFRGGIESPGDGHVGDFVHRDSRCVGCIWTVQEGLG